MDHSIDSLRRAGAEFPLNAVTQSGLECVLAEELRLLGARAVEEGSRVVSFQGDWDLLMRTNLHLRTALRVLAPLAELDCATPAGLYRAALGLDWNGLFASSRSFAIDATGSSEAGSTRFLTLKVKDAIVDCLRSKSGQRPDIDTLRPDLRLNLHFRRSDCLVSVDTSGESLHRRGYRLARTEAPLSEVLAAGLLSLSGWVPGLPLFDPMCGSGTFAIEAARRALNMAPGSGRRDFGFQRLPGFSAPRWQAMRDHALRAALSHTAVDNLPIVAADADPRAVEVARGNALRAGVGDAVRFHVCRFEQAAAQGLRRTASVHLVMNPPYGERLAPVENLYKTIGDTLKRDWSGSTAGVLAAGRTAINAIGLRPRRRVAVQNGGIDCRFLVYDLYAAQPSP